MGPWRHGAKGDGPQSLVSLATFVRWHCTRPGPANIFPRPVSSDSSNHTVVRRMIRVDHSAQPRSREARFFGKPSLVARIAIGKGVGSLVGRIGFIFLPFCAYDEMGALMTSLFGAEGKETVGQEFPRPMHDVCGPSRKIPRAAARASGLKIPKPVSARCLVLAAISVLNGCAFSEPFAAPVVVAGGETTVTLRTGSLRDADAYARRYCVKHGRRAVLITRGKMSERAITYHLYDCVPVDVR